MSEGKHTVPPLDKLPLIGYYRTKAEALEDTAHLLPGSVIICNLTGTRARRGSYDRPWQARAKVEEEAKG